MRPVATDRVAWSVCLCVGHVRELCKTGWIDRDAVSESDPGGPQEPCTYWMRSRFPWEGKILGVVQPAEKHRTNCCVCTLQKKLEGCTAADWSVVALHCSPVKNPPLPAMRLSSKFFDHLLTLDTVALLSVEYNSKCY